MRIAYLTQLFPAFSLSFIVDEVKSMRRLGLEIDLYSIRRPSESAVPPDYEPYRSETHYVLPVNLLSHFFAHVRWFFFGPLSYLWCVKFILTRKKTNLKERLRLFAYFFEAIALADSIHKNYDHIHVHFLFGCALVGLFLKKLTGISYSATAHGTDFLVEARYLEEKVHNAEFVRVGTQYNKQHISRCILPEDERKLMVIPFGIDVDAVTSINQVSFELSQEDKKEEGPSENRKVRIINVARLEWQKNQALLIKAARILDQKGLEFTLDIIGEGALRPQLTALINEYHLQHKVFLLGALPHSHVMKELKQSDIFAFTSVSEGFGIVLLEAMASRVAVVSSDIMGVSEIVQDGHTGLLFRSNDVEALAERLELLITKPELRSSCEENAYGVVREEFDQHRIMRALCDWFIGVGRGG